MAIDFKNIQFKYVKITGGSSTIDATMDDKKFQANKPDGYYRCFTFPSKSFAGNDYYDLKNLVDKEEKNIWDRVNRDTLLGYNEETKELIVNMNAYMGLKDSDLKTDGEISHPSQASWFIMDLSTTKSADSIINLKQTDGSLIYLSPKPLEVSRTSNTFKIYFPSSIAVDNIPKSVSKVPLITKTNGETLWCKSSEDGSAIMVNNFVKATTSTTTPTKLFRDNKEYGYDGDPNNTKVSTYKYGKKVFSFESTTSKNFVLNTYLGLKLTTQTSDLEVELTNTSNLNDIISSGESVAFYMFPKAKYYDFIYNKTDSRVIKYYIGVIDGGLSYISQDNNINGVVYSSNIDKNNEGIDCNLISVDSRKPFIYESNIGDIKCNGTNTPSSNYRLATNDFKNIPDGFIFLVSFNEYIFRYKKGDPVKRKPKSTTNFSTKISGTTQFTPDMFDYSDLSIDATTISKDDVINATGFTDAPQNFVDKTNNYINTAFVTILKI